jgi:hypothetical protein
MDPYVYIANKIRENVHPYDTTLAALVMFFGGDNVKLNDYPAYIARHLPPDYGGPWEINPLYEFIMHRYPNLMNEFRTGSTTHVVNPAPYVHRVFTIDSDDDDDDDYGAFDDAPDDASDYPAAAAAAAPPRIRSPILRLSPTAAPGPRAPRKRKSHNTRVYTDGGLSPSSTDIEERRPKDVIRHVNRHMRSIKSNIKRGKLKENELRALIHQFIGEEDPASHTGIEAFQMQLAPFLPRNFGGPYTAKQMLMIFRQSPRLWSHHPAPNGRARPKAKGRLVYKPKRYVGDDNSDVDDDDEDGDDDNEDSEDPLPVMDSSPSTANAERADMRRQRRTDMRRQRIVAAITKRRTKEEILRDRERARQEHRPPNSAGSAATAPLPGPPLTIRIPRRIVLESQRRMAEQTPGPRPAPTGSVSSSSSSSSSRPLPVSAISSTHPVSQAIRMYGDKVQKTNQQDLRLQEVLAKRHARQSLALEKQDGRLQEVLAMLEHQRRWEEQAQQQFATAPPPAADPVAAQPELDTQSDVDLLPTIGADNADHIDNPPSPFLSDDETPAPPIPGTQHRLQRGARTEPIPFYRDPVRTRSSTFDPNDPWGGRN